MIIIRMKIIIIITVMMNSSFALETIICKGRNENYTCEEYAPDDADNSYSYPEKYSSGNITYHEPDHSNYGNPDADNNILNGNEEELVKKETPDPIQPTFFPFYIFPLKQ